MNICDILDEYDDTFNRVCKQIDPSYVITFGTNYSALHEHELGSGVTELLLRGNFGRFTPAPLIRSLLEVIITRAIADTSLSKKYQGKKVILLPDFEFADILRAMDNNNIRSIFETEIVRRIYEWASIGIHRGWRMRHSSTWYALFAAGTIGAGLNNKSEMRKNLDVILDYLVSENKIQIQ